MKADNIWILHDDLWAKLDGKQGATATPLKQSHIITITFSCSERASSFVAIIPVAHPLPLTPTGGDRRLPAMSLDLLEVGPVSHLQDIRLCWTSCKQASMLR